MIWILLVVYQIKHFLADYPLQTPYMLGKFKKYPDFIHPLLTHASVHALFTMFIAMCCGASGHMVAGLGLFDMTVHFIVDRIKASPDLGGRWQALSKNEMMGIIEEMKYYKEYPLANTTVQCKPQAEAKLRSNRVFWYALGVDQMAHHLTHYAIIAILVLK